MSTGGHGKKPDLPYESTLTLAQQRLVFKMRDTWGPHAACIDKEGFTSERTNSGKKNREMDQRAKAICRTCPVRVECLEHALHMPEVGGVWGGLNWEERKALMKRLGIVHD